MALRLRHFGEFFVAMWSDFAGRMSGGASVILTSAALYYEFIARNPKSALWALAAFSYLITSFSIWYKNHPDLIIEVRNVVLDTNYGGMLVQATFPLQQFVTIMLYISNTRQADNSIKSYQLSVNVYGRNLAGQAFPSSGLVLSSTQQDYTDLIITKLSVLKQGVPTEGCVRFGLDSEPNLRGGAFVLTITDAYNVLRKIKGRLPLDFDDGMIRSRNAPKVTLHN